ncbi:hypothetical protein C1637_24230 [Chryseobacterium lactis]|uniref:Uncharacterized protein n=1 Tax=Chryseobacterium lactis TaxID=1241981 RepID=A0A3G6REY5_CHRLC|nr:hypothetical protein [Chryseobacterium lactis]AZA83217.1 hypothetical protein EG342_15635 [Chryseobacterium lactis]AZB03602.1 hypothetical protein EG341_06505 [Chryseobacterium lactis]PNW11187.1 hypothetical protein C1637_24230 [Chryseobacterium lactis]
MKMVKSNLNKTISLLVFFVSITIYSQKVNLIIFINDEIITSPLGLEFHNNTSTNTYKYTYSPGKEVDTDISDIFKENMILQFNAYGDKENLTKRYSYNIPLEAGLFNDTSFLIIKIYNLDKKEYRKKYCKSKELYIVDFHKSGLHINTGICK